MLIVSSPHIECSQIYIPTHISSLYHLSLGLYIQLPPQNFHVNFLNMYISNELTSDILSQTLLLQQS